MALSGASGPGPVLGIPPLAYTLALMVRDLPRRVDPLELCDRGVSLSGTLPLAGMERLCDRLTDRQGTVHIELAFARDALGRRHMAGRAEVAVQAQCERCLNPVAALLEARIEALVVPGGARQDDEGLDSLEATGEPMSLSDLVEDELLLAAPMYFKHPAGRCEAPQGTPGEAAPEPVPRPAKPFAVLARLKVQGRGGGAQPADGIDNQENNQNKQHNQDN